MKIQTASLDLYGLPVVLTTLPSKTPTGHVGTAAVVLETDYVTSVTITSSLFPLAPGNRLSGNSCLSTDAKWVL